MKTRDVSNLALNLVMLLVAALLTGCFIIDGKRPPDMVCNEMLMVMDYEFSIAPDLNSAVVNVGPQSSGECNPVHHPDVTDLILKRRNLEREVEEVFPLGQRDAGNNYTVDFGATLGAGVYEATLRGGWHGEFKLFYINSNQELAFYENAVDTRIVGVGSALYAEPERTARVSRPGDSTEPAVWRVLLVFPSNTLEEKARSLVTSEGSAILLGKWRSGGYFVEAIVTEDDLPGELN